MIPLAHHKSPITHNQSPSMRIAYLMQDAGSVYGAERATLDLAAGLMAEGSSEALLVLIKEERMNLVTSDYVSEAEKRGVPCLSVATSGRVSPALVRAIRDVLDEQRVDVLHTIGYKADLHGCWATGSGKRMPVVSTVHGWLNRPEIKERFYGWINRHALKRFQRVIVLSRYYEQWLARLGLPNLVRIPSGFPEERLIPPETAWTSCPPPEPMIVGMMGRLSEEKNHALFLRMARRFAEAKRPVRFLIAGDGPQRRAIEAAIHDQRLHNQVSLLGYTNSDDFLRQIHVLVMCSHIENMPYSILEAMNWMRPVIATRVGGMPDLIDDRVTGRLVSPDDDRQMAECVEELIGNTEALRSMGMAARTKLEREFPRSAMVNRHMDIYRSLI